ncbi:MAG: plasmid maintenance protein CcdB [Myxococcales bacterium]|nr:plasmid maintenance protein CcdB [Myxococcales bacterium]
MAQFDLHKDRKGRLYPLLLDVQADLLSHLDTRTVVPLAPKPRFGAKPLRRLNPVISFGGVEYVLVFQEMAAISIAELGDVQGTLASHRTELIAAIDFLFTGS